MRVPRRTRRLTRLMRLSGSRVVRAAVRLGIRRTCVRRTLCGLSYNASGSEVDDELVELGRRIIAHDAALCALVEEAGPMESLHVPRDGPGRETESAAEVP